MGDLLRKFWIRGTQSEPYSPWQVRAELCVNEIKKSVRGSLDHTGCQDDFGTIALIITQKLEI